MTDRKRPHVIEESEGVVTMSDEMDNNTGSNNLLQPLQSAILTGDKGAIKAALNQVLGEEETILLERMLVQVSEKKDEGDMEEDIDSKTGVGGNDKIDEVGADNDLTGLFHPMSLIVTSERCLFITTEFPSNGGSTKAGAGSSNTSSKPSRDSFWVDGKSIQLHAQAADPLSIYLQVDGDTEEARPTEITIIPDNNNNSQSDLDDTTAMEQVCEKLFVTITKLIELHPLQDNMDGGNDSGGGMMGMMALMAAGHPQQQAGNNNHEGSMSVGPPSTTEATPEERAAMLERLDNMLVVKPGLEMVQGQFSDAEDEEDDCDNDEEEAIVGAEPEESMVTTSEEVEAVPPPQPGQFEDAGDDEIDPLL